MNNQNATTVQGHSEPAASRCNPLNKIPALYSRIITEEIRTDLITICLLSQTEWYDVSLWSSKAKTHAPFFLSGQELCRRGMLRSLVGSKYGQRVKIREIFVDMQASGYLSRNQEKSQQPVRPSEITECHVFNPFRMGKRNDE